MGRHIVVFDVGSADDLGSTLAEVSARRGVRFARPIGLGPTQRWSAQGGRDEVVPVWHWTSSVASLRDNARHVLNEFVYPLARSAPPSCVAFPFPADVFTPRPLELATRSGLDLEDIGHLLAGSIDDTPPLISVPDTSLENAVEGLDADQRSAALHRFGPARVLAAAGSGKTKTMVARIGALVAAGVAPKSILVLAFNTEAAVQLEERLADVGVPTTRTISAGADGVHCATFNAFGHRFQRHILGDAPEVSPGRALQERLLRVAARPPDPARSSAAASLDPYDATATDDAWELDRSLSLLRAELRPPDRRQRRPLEAYLRLQMEQGIQTFDDQIIATVEALLADPAARRLVQDLYRFVLVDEFQDVNPAQVALLDILSRPDRNLFVVGDDDQLIYGWRSAHVANIVDFGHDLPSAPYTAYFTLPTNYRCARAIVSRAEQLVLCNRRRAEKTMQARPGAGEGAVHVAAAPKLSTRLVEAAAFLATERSRLGCDWHELAVLCRYRSQLESVAQALPSWGVPTGAAATSDEIDAASAARLGDALRSRLAGHDARQLESVAAVEEAVRTLGRADACRTAGFMEVADCARLLACRLPKLSSFCDAWRAYEQSGGEHAADGVTLATIHATKGREYRSVAIVDFAPAVAALSDDEREEERRVLYVGLTRAKERALLTIDLSRGEPHPYLAELARPPDRRTATAARRSVRDLGRRLRMTAPSLPSAVAALLDGDRARPPAAHNHRRTSMSVETAMLAADYLQARSVLVERRVFGRRHVAAAVARWVGGS